MSLLGVAIMVKNEEKTIIPTLESIKNIADELIVYDTGSTDGTINNIEHFANENKISLNLIRGDFVDFSTSRNFLLDYAETIDVFYLLLLDANDIVQNSEELRTFCETYLEKPTAFILQNTWKTGLEENIFDSVKMIKNKTDWRYSGKVHELITNPKNKFPLIKLPFTIYQNRDEDDKKTDERLKRDLELLLDEFESTDVPRNRCLYYLGLTYYRLNDLENSRKYFTLRVKENGDISEKFASLMRLGEIAFFNKETETALNWFLEAYDTMVRVEPLLRIVELYMEKKAFKLAHIYSLYSITLDLKSEAGVVNLTNYKFTRWMYHAYICKTLGVSYKEYMETAMANAPSEKQKELCQKLLA